MKAMRGWALLGASLAAAAVGGCGDDDNPGTGGDAGPSDAKSDTRTDTSTPTPDAAPDTGGGERDATTTSDAADGASIGEGGGEAGDGGPSLVQRGEYLVNNVAVCGDCHTPRIMGAPDNTRFLAGVAGRTQVPGLGPDGGVGVVGSANLTPDMATGLGSWTDVQIKRAFLDGVDKDDKALYPAMRYYVLHNMSAQDADAIVAYLRTIPAVSNAIPERNFDVPAPALLVPADRIPDPTLAATDPNYASAMRGKYLAGNIGVCMDCHTPHVQTPGAVPLDLDKLFGGGDTFGGFPSPFPAVIYSENITPHATGLQGWTAAAVANVLKNGVDKDGVPICPPMPNGPLGGFGGITDSDARDIGNYITHLPPISNTIPLICHDYVNRPDAGPDGGGTDGPTGDGAVTPDSGPDGNAPPDATPDATGDGAGGDSGRGGSDGSTSDGDGASGDGSTGGDGADDRATSDGATQG